MAFHVCEIFQVLHEADVAYVVVGGLAVIMQMKQAAARPLDLDDIEALREIARETGAPTQ